jgi:hypothetical protein
MESQQSKSKSKEKQSVVKTNVQDQNFSHGSLTLNAEKLTLVEEVKILIRKLWN